MSFMETSRHSTPNQEIFDWTDRAVRLAMRCARQCGLDENESEDCAMEFVGRLLDRAHPLSLDAVFSPAWLFRCATNHAIDYRRAQRRRQRRECVSFEDLTKSLATPEHSRSGGEAFVMQSWSVSQIMLAIDCLCPRQKQAFIGYYLHSNSLPVLAAALSQTPHALEQTLFRARARLRQILAHQGITEDDLRSSFS